MPDRNLGEARAEQYNIDYSVEYPASPNEHDAWGIGGFASHPGSDNPVLTAGDFTLSTGEPVDTVADPFVVRDGSTFYMFVEAKESTTPAQNIHYATSDNGLDWTEQGEAISTTNDDSYPIVVKHNGNWYMMPMEAGVSSFDVYIADTFPGSWSVDTTITIPTNAAFDGTIFRYNGLWWLCWGDQDTNNNDNIRLAYNDTFPADSFTEHPSSPIRAAGTNERPGGRPIVHDDYVDIPLQVKVDGNYGRQVRMYRITTLDTSNYADVEHGNSPILQGNGARSASWDLWNGGRMHHFDPILTERGEISMLYVDGSKGSGPWSVGVFAPTSKEPIQAEMGLSTAQTVTSGSTETLQLDEILFDSHRQVATGNYTWTAPQDGLYRIYGQLGMDYNLGSNNRITLDLMDDGSNSRIRRSNTNGIANVQFQSVELQSRLVYLSSSQTVRFDVENTAGSNIDILDGNDQSGIVIERVDSRV